MRVIAILVALSLCGQIFSEDVKAINAVIDHGDYVEVGSYHLERVGSDIWSTIFRKDRISSVTLMHDETNPVVQIAISEQMGEADSSYHIAHRNMAEAKLFYNELVKALVTNGLAGQQVGEPEASDRASPP